MKDLDDDDEFVFLRKAFAKGLYVHYGSPVVTGPIVRRVCSELEYVPCTVDGIHTHDVLLPGCVWDHTYTEQSCKWFHMNQLPGLLEEKPWTEEMIRAEIARRDRDKAS